MNHKRGCSQSGSGNLSTKETNGSQTYQCFCNPYGVQPPPREGAWLLGWVLGGTTAAGACKLVVLLPRAVEVMLLRAGGA